MKCPCERTAYMMVNVSKCDSPMWEPHCKDCLEEVAYDAPISIMAVETYERMMKHAKIA